MSLANLFIPKGYTPSLGIRETALAIKAVKDVFERQLVASLGLERISAPLFVLADSGLNDDLNGVERAVTFDVPDVGVQVQIVHSLAKWKRFALARYAFSPGEGLYTDMNAIRRDEVLDNLHSIYVDQWDWELVIEERDRTLDFLKKIVIQIAYAIKQAEVELCSAFEGIEPMFSDEVFFITSEELLARYPHLSPKERENAIAREKKTVFLMQIGDTLSNGTRHDGRAPDYDDWALNGDILVHYPLLDCAMELSSMGIRVSPSSLQEQLEKAGCPERAAFPYHKALLDGKLPYTIGGGIGQSRLCMMLLQKAHIGEVQASIWPEDMSRACQEAGILLL